MCAKALGYPLGMTIRALLFLALVPGTALHAEIYRWVDADGQVHFSDRRMQGAERTGIPTAATRAPNPPAATPPEADEAAFLGPYTAFEIVAPGANETLTQDKSDLAVSLILDPPLLEGHRVEAVLNGVAVPLANAATQFRLSGASFGSHRLQVQIRDADGDLIARTALQSVHLRQTQAPQEPQEPGLLR